MKLAKPELPSLEVAAVVKELQVLVGSKIDQIYEAEDNEYIIQCHPRGKEKILLKIKPSAYLYITSKKPETATPKTFCMQLRKHIAGGIITAVNQIDAQRIVEITLGKTEQQKLTVELFSKGNLILSDDKNAIIGLLERQSWQSRELRPRATYQLPPLDTNIFEIEKGGVEEKLAKTEKEKIVTALAIELGIGGLYAEEACFRAAIDKNTSPKKLTKQQREELWKALQSILKELNIPQGCIYEGGIVAPIVLQTQKLKEKIQRFSEALDKVLSITKEEREKERQEEKFRQKIVGLQRIEAEQQQKLHECETKIEEKTKRAEWIYEHYNEVKQLLELVEKTRASGGWQAVAEMLKKMKKIKSIDLKEKKITVEINNSKQ